MKHSTEQLVYVPLNQLVVAPYVNWKGFKFEVTNRFTSSVTATNNTTLPSFTTLDLRLSHEIKFKNEGYGLTYYVGLLNATNSNYQVVLNRPMAPLSFELGAAFKVTGNKK